MQLDEIIDVSQCIELHGFMCSLMSSKNSILEHFLEIGKAVNIFKVILYLSNIQMEEKHGITLRVDVRLSWQINTMAFLL